MKRNLFFLIVISVLMGCVSDHDSDGPVSILSVTSATVPASVTRATAVTSGTLVVSRFAENGYTARSNVKYTYSSSTSSWTTSDTPIQLSGANASIFAYYPYGVPCITDATDPTSVTLTSQKYDATQDFCYLPKTLLNNSNSNITFNMKRAYAEITFIITRNSTYTGTCAISNISITHSAIKTSGGFNMVAGTYDTGTVGTVSYNPGISSISSGTSVATSVLMVPVTTVMTGNVTFSFTVDGVVKSVTLDASSNNLSSLASGNNYKANVTLRSNAILEINNPVTVTDWNVTDLGFIGKVQSYYPESNCYMVAPGDSVYIPVSRALNNPSITQIPATWTTGLLWTDKPNPLTSTGTVKFLTANIGAGFIIVKTGSTEGNAVVYMKNPSGTILWSWHIWVTGYDPNINNVSYNTFTWMNRNLGATTNVVATVSTKGLLYQWGRKDPSPSSSSIGSNAEPTLYGEQTNITLTAVAASPNLVNSIQHPLTFYTGSDWYTTGTQNNTLWYNGTITKTIYDPCPVGWRIPYYIGTTPPWNGLTTAGSWNYGFSWASVGYYPAVGTRSNSSGQLIVAGIYGNYWAANVNGTYAWYLSFASSQVGMGDIGYRSYGLPVRCVKSSTY